MHAIGSQVLVSQTWPEWSLFRLGQLLEQHFAHAERHALGSTGKSISQALAERLAVLGYQCVECENCEGSGADKEGKTCKRCKGIGEVSWAEADRCQFAAEVCDVCNGSKRYWRKRYPLPNPGGPKLDKHNHPVKRRGVQVFKRGKPSRFVGNPIARTDLENMACCVECRGEGRRETLTAVPGQETQSVPEIPEAQEYGTTQPAMSRLRETQPVQHNTISLLYGPEGMRAAARDLTRGFALWHLTAAGAAVCRANPRTPQRALVELSERAATDSEAAATVETIKAQAFKLETKARQALWQSDVQTGQLILRQASKLERGIR